MIDLHQPGTVYGLSDREMAIIGMALGVRRADLLGMRRIAEAAGLPVEIGRYAGLILEVDLLRVKLGLSTDEESTT